MKAHSYSLAAFAILFSFVVTSSIVAEESDIIVTPSKIEQHPAEVASSTSFIKVDDYLPQAGSNLTDLLRDLPGVDVIQSGSLGGNASVFLRGANPEHTLVLVDGVELNSPINPTHAYNFADLPVNNIDRIEVVRGPQSVLYGSDAMGGVIQIFTKTGKGPLSNRVKLEAGSYGTFAESAAATAGSETRSFSLSAAHIHSHSISSAAPRLGNNEPDPYDRLTVNGSATQQIGESSKLSLFGRYHNAHSDLDNFGGAGGDDLNRKLDNEEMSLRSNFDFTSISNQLSHLFSVSWAKNRYDDDSDPDELNPLEILRSDYAGDKLAFELQNTANLATLGTTVFGLLTKEEKAQANFFSDGIFGPFEDNLAEQQARTNAFYLQHQLPVTSALSVGAGVRHDDPDTSDAETTWRVTPLYKLEAINTAIKGSIGTGFKAPSLYQLYSSYGFKDLKSETSTGYDFGIEKNFEIFNSVLSLTYFSQDFNDLISFDPNTFKFENIQEAETRGIESTYKTNFSEQLNSTLTYTWTDTEDKITGTELLRRPQHKGSIGVNFQALENLNLKLKLRYIGRRFDNDFNQFPAERVSLKSYFLTDLGAEYAFSEKLSTYLRLENLFDEEYEEVLGYGTRGFGAYAGVSLSL